MSDFHTKRREFNMQLPQALFLLNTADALERDPSPDNIERIVMAMRARGEDLRDRANAALKEAADLARAGGA